MKSICGIIDKYITYYELKKNIEKTCNIDNSLKKQRKSELENINLILSELYNEFIEKINILDIDYLKNTCNIIESHINKYGKENKEITTLINLDLKRTQDVNKKCNLNEMMTHADKTSKLFLKVEELNDKIKIYNVFLEQLKEKLNVKVYKKVV